MRGHAWIAITIPLVVGCANGDPDPPPGPGDTNDVAHLVRVAPTADVRVTIDDVELAPTATRFLTTYDDYASARAAPLLRIETWRDGVMVDEIGLGIGACEETCLVDPTLGCDPEAVRVEDVPATFDENGVFEGGASGPRSWRGIGSLRCTFADGTTWVVTL